jgi:hypothetical protein
MRKIIVLVLSLFVAIFLSSCMLDGSDTSISTVTLSPEDSISNITSVDSTYIFSNSSITSPADSTVTDPSLTESSTQPVAIDGSTLSIDQAGTYQLTGTKDESNIIINVGDSDTVILQLAGLNLSCSYAPVIYVENADKVIIILEEGTTNLLSDTMDASNEHHALIDSHDDVTINGLGTLILNANMNNAINVNDDLVIGGGVIDITAKNNGINVNKSITIANASVSISAKGDGIQAEGNDELTDGSVYLLSGEVTISSYGDGIQANETLMVQGGTVSIDSGVGNSNIVSTSAKGLKAGTSLTIVGGTISISSKDDAIHSNDALSVQGGEIHISSNDDGLHADTLLEVSNGNIIISKSYEGLESQDIVISGGMIKITSSDDGINGAGGVDSSGSFPWGGRPGGQPTAGNATLTISGGSIFINSVGDGLDVNGSIAFSDGLVVIAGPTSSANGAIDFDGSFNLTGGTLIAVGSAGMAQGPSTSSKQNSVQITLNSSSSSLIHVEDSVGKTIFSFAPGKSYQSIIISSPNFKTNTVFKVFLGGAISDSESNMMGYYYGGSYSEGSLLYSFTVSSGITYVGQSGRW